jgi:phosphoglycolate phosphatase
VLDLAGWEDGRVPPHVRPELLVLWDVDHTLIENGGVSKETYLLAYELLTGRGPTVPPETDGRTDLAIMDSLLRDNESDPRDYPLERRWEALSVAGERKRHELAKRGRALPGAERALKRLGGDPRIVQSALTGNIEVNARVKLGTFGLDRALDFEVGAFGAESAIRSHLVAIAQGKARQKYSFDSENGVTVLIGDTPLDVQAGVDGGARVIGVATGATSEQALRLAGADVALPDLTDTDALLGALDKCRELGPRRSTQRAGS